MTQFFSAKAMHFFNDCRTQRALHTWQDTKLW